MNRNFTEKEAASKVGISVRARPEYTTLAYHGIPAGSLGKVICWGTVWSSCEVVVDWGKCGKRDHLDGYNYDQVVEELECLLVKRTPQDLPPAFVDV